MATKGQIREEYCENQQVKMFQVCGCLAQCLPLREKEKVITDREGEGGELTSMCGAALAVMHISRLSLSLSSNPQRQRNAKPSFCKLSKYQHNKGKWSPCTKPWLPLQIWGLHCFSRWSQVVQRWTEVAKHWALRRGPASPFRDTF